MKIKYLIIALMLFFVPFVYADCVDLNDESTYNGSINKWSDTRYEIIKSIILCPGTYNIADGLVLSNLYKTLDCDGATLEGAGAGIGVFIGRGATIVGTYSPTNLIKNCNIVNYHTGIAINLANLNTIENNNITNCYTGISISGSANNTIDSNKIKSSGYKGIVLDMATTGYRSSYNIITNNRIEGNAQGGMEVRLFSHKNLIYKNYFINNNIYGLFVDYSENNTIYDNFFNNTKNAIATKPNFWSIQKTSGTNIIGGSFVGGNYWSDYSGADSDGDGIGDIAKTINTNSDFLPLVYPTNIEIIEETNESEEAKEICEYLSKIINKIDREKEISIPGMTLFKKETFNIYTKNNEKVGHIEIYDKKIKSFDCNISNKPTYNVYIKDVTTLRDIDSSEKKITTFTEKLSSKEITLKGTSIFKTIKMGIAKIGINIAKIFIKK